MKPNLALTTFLAAAFAALLPAQPVVYHSVSGAQHQTQHDTLTPLGYRPISLSIHGTVAAPRYAAVWVQRAGPRSSRSTGSTASPTRRSPTRGSRRATRRRSCRPPAP